MPAATPGRAGSAAQLTHARHRLDTAGRIRERGGRFFYAFLLQWGILGRFPRSHIAKPGFGLQLVVLTKYLFLNK